MEWDKVWLGVGTKSWRMLEPGGEWGCEMAGNGELLSIIEGTDVTRLRKSDIPVV